MRQEPCSLGDQALLWAAGCTCSALLKGWESQLPPHCGPEGAWLGHVISVLQGKGQGYTCLGNAAPAGYYRASQRPSHSTPEAALPGPF